MREPSATHGTTFTDVTSAWKLSPVRGNRISVVDLDNDGYPDIVISSNAPNHRVQLALPDGGAERLVNVLMNRASDGGRVFESRLDNGFFAVRGFAENQLRSANLAVFGDVDNDGDLDGFSGSYTDPQHPETDTTDRSEIMLNDGNGVFEFAPSSATSPRQVERLPTSSASLVDFDRDGRLDVWVGNWYQDYGGSALGVTGVDGMAALPSALVRAYAYCEDALVERFHDGIDVSVVVVGRDDALRALTPVSVEYEKGHEFDFSARYTAEFVGLARPDLPEELVEDLGRTAVAAHRALGLCDVSRSDFIVSADGSYVVLETAITPGTTETSVMPFACTLSGTSLGQVTLDLVRGVLT